MCGNENGILPTGSHYQHFFLRICLVTSNGKSVYWQGEKISQYVFIVSRSREERRR